ncbi:MAG: EFR1 family ferrodoxin [Spirochaetaceae bacterium]
MSDAPGARIYYFSGTGNSLHLARELAAQLPRAVLVPMIAEVGRTASAEIIGFVFPVHLTTLPRPVRAFVKRIDVSGARYVFAAATRIGTFQVADIHLDRILARRRSRLDAFFVFNMPANSPCGVIPKSMPGFKRMVEAWPGRIEAERVNDLCARMTARLPEVSATIRRRERHFDGRTRLNGPGRALLASLMTLTGGSSAKQALPFYADAGCTGCGICEAVCPSGRVTMPNGTPVWREDTPCYLCYACFNSCPEQAILLRDRYTGKQGRYLHPAVTTADLAAQKGA